MTTPLLFAAAAFAFGLALRFTTPWGQEQAERITAAYFWGVVLGSLIAGPTLGCAAPPDPRATPCADQVCAHLDPGDTRLDRCLLRCVRRP